ncbi:hypothetical protein GOZ94_12745 [Agrobacterium vitis]|uniref:cation:proton antiporter n=1 Tax=Agrobacterium vitis TaxID=373 RepID=UPI0012E868FB|nr:cation:proton antiporter [Agrobacterium vitis]MVA19818.1 hypothetical protein [Agrobacterium vitis]
MYITNVESIIYCSLILIMSFFAFIFFNAKLFNTKIPKIILYIIFGIFLGPYSLNVEGWFELHRVGARIGEIYALSNVALGFLIVTSFSNIRSAEKQVDLKSLTSYMAGTFAALLLALSTSHIVLRIAPGLTFPSQTVGEERATILVLALAVIVTSVPFLTKIFIDLKMIGTTFSSTVLVSACLLDILIWAVFPISDVLRTQSQFDLLPVLTSLVMTLTAAGALFLVTFSLVKLYDTWAQRHESGQIGIAFIVAVSLAAALTSASLGAGLLLGMLIAGLCLGRAKSIAERSMPFLAKLAHWVFIPAYFILVGRGLVFDNAISIYDIAVFLLWSSALKITSVTVTHFLMSKNARQSFLNGVVFNTRGGPGLVLATVAYSMNLINVNAFSAFVVASIITAPVTELVLRYRADYAKTSTVGDAALEGTL